MGIGRIGLRYEADLREITPENRVYGLLRDNGFDPLNVENNYNADHGIGFVIYSFRGDVKLPSKSKLEQMLKAAEIDARVIEVRWEVLPD